MKLAEISWNAGAKSSWRCSLCLLCASAVGDATAMQSPAMASSMHHVQARLRSRQKLVLAGGRSTNASSNPATVSLEDGRLKIEANNSDLSEILKNVANASGMTIEGSVGEFQVFGSYGPLSPREVLTSLLTGAGYNFIMVGSTADGAPRQLLLSQQAILSGPITMTNQGSNNANLPVYRDTNNVRSEQSQTTELIDDPPRGAGDAQQRMQQRLERLQQMREASTPNAP